MSFRLDKRVKYDWPIHLQDVGDVHFFPDKTAKELGPLVTNYLAKTFDKEAIATCRNVPGGAIVALIYLSKADRPGRTIPGEPEHQDTVVPIEEDDDNDDDFNEHEDVEVITED